MHEHEDGASELLLYLLVFLDLITHIKVSTKEFQKQFI